jgi:hypothetical protein
LVPIAKPVEYWNPILATDYDFAIDQAGAAGESRDDGGD